MVVLVAKVLPGKFEQSQFIMAFEFEFDTQPLLRSWSCNAAQYRKGFSYVLSEQGLVKQPTDQLKICSGLNLIAFNKSPAKIEYFEIELLIAEEQILILWLLIFLVGIC
jgi:hypothetical protein